MSLTKEYESIKVALGNQPNLNLTLEIVTQRLMDSEALMNDSKFVDKSSIKSPIDNVTFESKRKKLVCNFCSNKGHTSKFCRLKASKCFSCVKAGHDKNDCPVSKTAADSSTRHLAYEITFAARTLKEDKFIIDSGATSHMCSRKERFSYLEPASGIIKCSSKSAVLEIEGIGIIRGEISNNLRLNPLNEEVFLEKENKSLLFGHVTERIVDNMSVIFYIMGSQPMVRVPLMVRE
ncbi:hypothetical protein AVEN_192046-1 [Araneus ventricosus]|uniref:CCHC-type domain-containing protein n=1 Tax=Araneus ventricosus TaxID=182803 RepID=A0A4Y2B6P0_ARAVE|nr:hypothetical protein AVEN_192046-1 [Araneus ventricosus]